MGAFDTVAFDTNRVTGAASRGESAFGYAATEEKKHRRRVSSVTQSEDDVLKSNDRRKLKALADDLRRNFEVPAFGLRLHLDFVSGFTFRSTTGIDAWDDEVEAFIANWSLPQNCDAAGRHSLDSLGRLWESHRTVEGDCGVFKLLDGRTQLLEGDKLKDPPDKKPGETWIHGVKVNRQGAALAYAIHRRKGSGFEFERSVPASWMYLHACRDRYDQVRGVSPLAAAINRFRDVYEGFDLALAKSKVAQMLGLAVYRDYSDDEGSPNDTAEEAAARSAMFKLDPNKGPYTLNLTGKDKAEILESKTPSGEFQSFTQIMLRVGLLAFDIPDAFIDASKQNFATMRTALTLYLKRCRDKRRLNRELRDHLTRWRLGLAIANGELDPGKYGLTFDQILWRWIPHGNPYFDKGKEVPGDLAAVTAGIQTLGDVIEERFDSTLEDTLKRRHREEALARSLGLTIPGMAGHPTPATAKPTAPKPKPKPDEDEDDEDDRDDDEEDDRDED